MRIPKKPSKSGRAALVGVALPHLASELLKEQQSIARKNGQVTSKKVYVYKSPDWTYITEFNSQVAAEPELATSRTTIRNYLNSGDTFSCAKYGKVYLTREKR